MTHAHREPDAYHLLRAAVATAAQTHWRTLRKIAPTPDPRTVAAETVATAATSLFQLPALWATLHALDLQDADAAAEVLRRLEFLDHAASDWAACAYGRAHRAARATRAMIAP